MTNKEQKDILNHTLRYDLFCGGSKDMDVLCQNGLMEYAGRKTFVPDAYYKITAKGKMELKNLDSDTVSLCKHCNCMTHTVNGKCGKCKGEK